GDGEEPTDPGDGDTGEEDFLPFTDQPTDEAEDFLPYTGGEILALLTAAGTAAISGAALRRRNKSAR
ncbi:MAG: LPXTG cell wall anchor domain-containing protein, partial [Anaerosomatales bacterium]|nr:LPXTG cell wall anchor domain-containing protein [Anaerosomatales bacterium]